MDTMASQITSLTIVYSTIYSGADQRKHQSSASLAFVSGNSPVTGEFPAKGPVTWKMSPFDDVIMKRWLVCQILYIKGRDKTTSHSICYVGCNRFSLPLIAASAHQSWIEAIICTFHGQKAIHIWPLSKAQYIKMHYWKCDVQSYWTLLASIMIFQIWRSSRHSRLPHRRAHYSTEQVHPDRPVWGQSSKLLPCTCSQLRLSVFSYISFM